MLEEPQSLIVEIRHLEGEIDRCREIIVVGSYSGRVYAARIGTHDNNFAAAVDFALEVPNLNDERLWFFEHFDKGDVVIVTNSGGTKLPLDDL